MDERKPLVPISLATEPFQLALADCLSQGLLMGVDKQIHLRLRPCMHSL